MKKILATGVGAAMLFGLASVALAQTAPGLMVSVTSPSSIAAGAANQLLASIRLDAGSAGARLTSLPISLGYSNASPSQPFSNCALRNSSNAAVALNTGANSIGPVGVSSLTVTFDQPLSIAANGSVTLLFTCDISSATPNGSAAATTLFVDSIAALGLNGETLTVSVLGAPGSDATLRGVTTISSTTPPPGPVTPPPATPGIPATGLGGDAPILWTLLAVLALAALGSGVYFVRLARRA